MLNTEGLRDLRARAELAREDADLGRWRPNASELLMLRALAQSKPHVFGHSPDPALAVYGWDLTPLTVPDTADAVISADAIRDILGTTDPRHCNRVSKRVLDILMDAACLQDFPSTSESLHGRQALVAVTEMVRAAAARRPRRRACLRHSLCKTASNTVLNR